MPGVAKHLDNGVLVWCTLVIYQYQQMNVRTFHPQLSRRFSDHLYFEQAIGKPPF